MKGKIVGLAVILLLVMSILATGLGVVAQGGNPDWPNGGSGPALAQVQAADAAAAEGSENALYTAFTYVCPFH